MHSKLLVFIIILLIGLIEFYRGSFKNFCANIKTAKIRACLKLFFLFLMISAAMFFGDAYLISLVQKLDHPFFAFFARVGAQLGRGVYPWLFMIVWYFSGHLIRRKSWIGAAVGAIFSAAAASVLCTVIKISFLRARPNAGLGPFSFFNLEGLLKGNNLFQSFPSGDVVVVAGAAYYLLQRTQNKILKMALFIIPLTTAFARMNANRHWPSDVFLSLGFGWIASALAIVLTQNRTGSSGSNTAHL